MATILVNVALAPGFAAGPHKLVAFGDSLTAGYGLAREDSFPVRLEAALKESGLDVTVVNAGVSGDTTTGGLSRLDWAVPEGTEAVIVELGANDGLRGIDPKVTEANLDAVLSRLKGRGVAVLLAGMLAPPNLGKDYGAEFNALYPRLAERHGVAFYPFFLDGVAADPDLNQDDGIHPTADGVEVIVERILPYVRRLFTEN